MQNVQNAAEIQQRVINLVELYRTKVGKESKIAKNANAEFEYWEKENEKMAMEAFDAGESFFGCMYGEGPHTEVWINHLKVNEQLLGYFYSVVAGDDAEKDVLDQLLLDFYDRSIYNKEEEEFLANHFKEMVNYIILTPCDDDIELLHRADIKDRFTIPTEVLKLIKSRAEIPSGSKVYYPDTIFAQLANLFDGCSYYCDTMFYAWTRIALFANNIATEAFDVESIPSSCDAIVSYISNVSEDSETIMNICKAYNNLIAGGILILLCPSELLADKEGLDFRMNLAETLKYKEISSVRKELDKKRKNDDVCSSFRRMLVESKAIKEIIQIPKVMSNNTSCETYSLLIAVKGRKESEVTLIDARTASKNSDNKNFEQSFDNAILDTIMQNGGYDPSSGLRKVVTVNSDKLSEYLLIPQVYTAERPLESEHPVRLSNLSTFESTKVRDIQYDLPEKTPWIYESDLMPLFTGDLDMSSITKADCPNNPPFVEGSKDYAFDKDGKFVDSIWVQMNTKKGYHVLNYRKCTFLDGTSDIVLYKHSSEHGVRVGIVRSTGIPYVVSKGILAFRPKEDVDANTIAALLRLPIVYRQLIAYEQYNIGYYLDAVLVPTDIRIIGDELFRMKQEESVTKKLENDFAEAQKKHKQKLEDYQHAMRKPMRQISSAMRRMERFIKDMKSSEESKQFLMERLHVIKTHQVFLSEDIERLNEENTYGEASPFDIDHSLRSYRDYFGSDVCSIKYTNEITNDTIRHYRMEHQDEFKNLDEKSQSNNLEVALAESSLAYVDIAEYNFGKIVRNILENAKKHGFDDFIDVDCKDYMIEIALNWDKERNMYRIDFRNNGNPLPEGLTKDSYGENRKYAGRTGGTGIGGYEVAENVKHYNGDYAISQDGNWIVVSIYLPKSKTYGERL